MSKIIRANMKFQIFMKKYENHKHMLMFFISFSKTCFQWKMCRKIMKIMQFVKDFWKMIFMQKIFEFISICLWFPSRFEFPLICENPLRIFCCFWMIFGTNSLRIFQKLIFSKKSFKNISICLWFGSWLARASKKKNHDFWRVLWFGRLFLCQKT